MPLPVQFNTGTVTGQFKTLDGEPQVGTISFHLDTNRLIVVPANMIILPAVPALEATLDANGAFVITLPATNDPDVLPVFRYIVVENFSGGTKYNLDVPIGEIVDISEVTHILTPGGSSGSGFTLEPGSITTNYLADESVTVNKLGDGAVATVKIADGAVTANKVGADVATQAELDAEQARAEGVEATLIPQADMGANDGVATLDSVGKLTASQMPTLTFGAVFPDVANEAAMLALSTAVVGDIAIRVDISTTFILTATPPSTLGNWAELPSPTGAITSVDGLTGTVTLPADAAANVASKRTLGAGALQAASGTLDLVAKGQIPTMVDFSGTLVRTYLGAPTTDGHVLMADPTSVYGIKWAPADTIGAQYGAQPIVIAASNSPDTWKAVALASGGEVCDGVDDDVTINNAITYANNALVKRPVQLGPGQFNVNMTLSSGFWAAIRVPSSIWLYGCGHLTVVRLVNGANGFTGVTQNNSYMVVNADPTAGNQNIRISDLVFDGNAGNQTNVHHGISFWRTNRTLCERVTVKNCRGTAGVGSGETFHFDILNGANAAFIECRAEGDRINNVNSTIQTASGFSSNRGSVIRYYGCVAEGMTIATGFTCYEVRNILYANCSSRQNAGFGFNWEYSDDVMYVNCVSGGEISHDIGSNAPYVADQSLGNASYGFVGLGGVPSGGHPPHGFRATLTNCISRKNLRGLFLNGVQHTSVIGGAYCDNDIGITMTGGAVVPTTTRISPETFIFNNATAQLDLPGSWYTSGGIIGGNIGGTSNLPASGVALKNPLPFGVFITLIGGTISGVTLVGRDGFSRALGVTRTVKLPPGCDIIVSYSGTPTWEWVQD